MRQGTLRTVNCGFLEQTNNSDTNIVKKLCRKDTARQKQNNSAKICTLIMNYNIYK